MNLYRIVSRSAALLLAAGICLPALAEQMRPIGDYEAHYSLVPTLFLKADIAAGYDITRSRDRALLTVSILDADGGPVTADVRGRVKDLLGVQQALDFEEVREGPAVYYLATIRHSDRDVLRFDIRITTPDGADHELAFQQKMYWGKPMKIVLASGNRGKLGELRTLLEPLGISVESQAALGIRPAPEEQLTFAENALEKARHAARQSGLPAMADDSGLVVPVLGGAPGIRSARYAGTDGDAAANNAKLVAALADVEHPAAHFYCALVYLRHPEDPAPLIATARWHGTIVREPRGSGGFGYDPHFYLPDLGRCAAELSADEKNRRSHRGQAMAALLGQLREEI